MLSSSGGWYATAYHLQHCSSLGALELGYVCRHVGCADHHWLLVCATTSSSQQL